MSPALAHLLDAGRALLAAKAGELHMTGAELASIRPCDPPPAKVVPGVSQIPGVVDSAGPDTAALAKAVLAAAPELRWRRTYSEADGFSRELLDSYGWFDLIGDEGLARADGIRVMIGFWGQGYVYPDHSHPPDEYYFVLAGAGWFRLADQPYRRLAPGEVFHTPSGAVHAAEMRDAPLLALAVWRHQDLSVRINLTDAGRDVSLSE